jgi:hypothetical protein
LNILEDLTDKVHMSLLDFSIASGRSMGMTVPTIASVATTYNSSTSSSLGGTKIGRDLRYCFSSKAFNALGGNVREGTILGWGGVDTGPTVHDNILFKIVGLRWMQVGYLHV